MKALSVLTVAASLAGSALGQEQPVLGDAQAIDVRVDRIDWHPHGDALLYSRAENGGVGIGVYRIGDVEGKVLLHLGEKDTWESQWLEGYPDALVIVYRSVQTGQGQQKEAAVYLLNGKAKTETEVFSKVVPNNEKIDLDVDSSPSLLHAIFRVKTAKETNHYVLPINGGKLIAAREIDEAVKAGHYGPSWSQDGTAIYGGIPGAGSVFTLRNGDHVTLGVPPDQAQVAVAAEKAVVRELTLKLAADKAISVGGTALEFKLVPPAPPVGASVFEVVPANGVLRPVRFKGAWQGAPTKPAKFESKTSTSQLVFGQVRGNSNSLWLMTGKTAGVMVAAHATRATIAPGDGAVAYVTDGALFVREIKPK
jgi:hypothetical protein